ncbi:MAG: helicase C-terminal domain-containing protein [Nanoarchaeota archaeon]
MIKRSDQNRLQSITTNAPNSWRPKEEVFEISQQINLKKSENLIFLKEEKSKTENIFTEDYWDLNDENGKISPLKFSNGKTQTDVVKEIINLIKNNEKIIFLHGACGTGKSAIALNIARVLGKTSIVVPVKALQKQYEDDYTSKKFLFKKNGQKMKIAVLTGRENHDSLINPGISCANPELPENIKITEKNYPKLAEYFQSNPFVVGREIPDLKHIRRLSVAPANPYWSPIVPSSYDLNQLKDAKKIKYEGCNNREYTFYHRKPGCSYYDQYLAYKNADIIIFNAAKYKAELAIGRKPATEVEIIDEADEFLDSLFQQEEINLTRLAASLASLIPENITTRETISKILELLKFEEQNKRVLGIDESQVFHIGETNLTKILKLIEKDKELEAEILLDENSYANKTLELANDFADLTEDIYLTYRKEEENLYVKLVSTNLAPKIQELLDKNKSLVFMSGTLHAENVLKHIFNIKNFKKVEAEAMHQGAIEIVMTGKERDCRYSNFSDGSHSRENYLKALNQIVEKAKRPTLIHVNAFQDLPTEEEKIKHHLNQLTSQEQLRHLQEEDKTGKAVAIFKQGLNDKLFTTKCSRGIDFPGEMCNSIIFTKYPNPNISDTFWTILKKTHPTHFWEFYRDKAYREFLQRIYRAVRSHDDHVYILSPDLRVIKSIQELQKKNHNSN